MIYTLGHTESYDRYFAEQGTPQKLGRDDPARGGRAPGSVWETLDEAKAVLASYPEAYAACSVYGVLADWESQTAPSQHGSHRDLLVSSDLVKLKAE